MEQRLNPNNQQKRKIPIGRNNLFFSKESYDFEVELARTYIEQDLGTSIIWYEINRVITNTDSLYFESKKDDIRFNTPIEIPCIYNIEQSQNNSYLKNKSMGRFSIYGNLEFWVLQETLNELGTPSFGDYIGCQVDEVTVIYFTITDSDDKPYGNEHTIYGYKPLYKHFKASPIDITEFDG